MGTQRQQEPILPIAKPPPDGLTWSFDLPDRLKCAIADCITLYARIESCVVETLWVLEEADLERRREIARAWGKENAKMIRKVIDAIPGAAADELWLTLSDLREQRNLIGHGVWMIANDGRPMVVWHARFLESAEWVGAEFYDWRRFDYFLERAEVVLKTFAEFKDLVEQGIQEERVRRQTS